MLKKIALVLVVLIAGVLVAAALRPDSFVVRREIVIAAPPVRAFVLVNDLASWRRWSPWEKLDPAMERRFSGPPAGPGAAYAWKGNREVGQGRMEIVESVAPAKLRIRLEFIEPFAATNSAEFDFRPEGDGTRVVWTMSGAMPFVSKLMDLFFGMDKMIGKDFEAGLANLKGVVEAR